MEHEKGTVKTFTDLHAWQHAHKLSVAIYKCTAMFPKDEIFGLISQMRRASVSATSNIAEGFSRRTVSDKTHFYAMAQGSLTELQSQLYIAKDVGYLTQGSFSELYDFTITTHRLITGLIRSTKQRTH